MKFDRCYFDKRNFHCEYPTDISTVAVEIFVYSPNNRDKKYLKQTIFFIQNFVAAEKLSAFQSLTGCSLANAVFYCNDYILQCVYVRELIWFLADVIVFSLSLN